MKQNLTVCCRALWVTAFITMAAASSFAAPAEIPELNWEPRSDWINVKTGVAPGAKGDGIADDTAALQAALDKLNGAYGEVHTCKTVYLPAGTYRITKTLSWGNGKNLFGVNLIGHGRATRIVWDGATTNAFMFHENGVAGARFTGIILDGAGKAQMGILNSSASTFEWDIFYQHMAFRNFTECGIYFGPCAPLPYANATCGSLDNCLFDHCDMGIVIRDYNALAINVTGCEFRQCGRGVSMEQGNTYIRHCHFEGSHEMDVYLAPSGMSSSSVEHCTSLGSRYFVFAGYYGYHNLARIVGCTVEGWTDPRKAIEGFGGGPLFMIDCTFLRPPSKNPPVHLSNQPYIAQRVVLSNNKSSKTQGIVNADYPHARITEAPRGKVSAALAGGRQGFLHETVRMPGKVFDAKRDFGAKGDGSDDSDAVHATIDAARAYGKNAIAYFPPGKYHVTKPLIITGADYYIGGAGITSSIKVDSCQVVDPQRLVIEYVELIGIHQTSTGKGSSIWYDDLNAGSIFGPMQTTLTLDGLSGKDAVHFIKVNCSVAQISNCQRATILANNFIGSALVESQQRNEPKDGFLGFEYLEADTRNALTVRDSQNVVVNDLYDEQAKMSQLKLLGNAGDSPGRVTIFGGSKLHTEVKEPIVNIDNYCGTVYLSSFFFGDGGAGASYVVAEQTGANPFDLLLVGCHFGSMSDPYAAPFSWKLSPSAKLTSMENGVGDGKWNRYSVLDGMLPAQAIQRQQSTKTYGYRRSVSLDTCDPLAKNDVNEPSIKEDLSNVVPPGSLKKIATAFDDVRRLLNLDLKWNYSAR